MTSNSSVRSLMLKNGDVVIGRVSDGVEGVAGNSVLVVHPVVLQQVQKQDGTAGVTFGPFFPMAEYTPSEGISIPYDFIVMDYPAVQPLADGHNRYVAEQSGIVVAGPGDMPRVDAEEMRSGLRLAQDSD